MLPVTRSESLTCVPIKPGARARLVGATTTMVPARGLSAKPALVEGYPRPVVANGTSPLVIGSSRGTVIAVIRHAVTDEQNRMDDEMLEIWAILHRPPMHLV